MLLSAIRDAGYEAIDGGIVTDKAVGPAHRCYGRLQCPLPLSQAALEGRIMVLLSQCDILITTGGVSMGSHDLVKPLLERMGKVHFGRLHMKPGTRMSARMRNSGASCEIACAASSCRQADDLRNGRRPSRVRSAR
jgi:hypothetical protein